MIRAMQLNALCELAKNTECAILFLPNGKVGVCDYDETTIMEPEEAENFLTAKVNYLQIRDRSDWSEGLVFSLIDE